MLADEWVKHFPNAKLFLDANNILTEETAYTLKKLGRDVLGIGKGHWRVTSKKEEKIK